MGAQCCSTVDNERASEVVRPPTLVSQHTAHMSSPPALDLSEVCSSDEARRHGPPDSVATKLKRFPPHLNKKLAAVKNSGEEFEFAPEKDNDMVGRAIFLGLRQLESQAIYVGQWWEKERNGRGLQIYPDGSVYEGYWLHGKRHGHGRFTDCSGDVYEGLWKEDAAEGEGKFIQATGAVFHGTWKDNKQNGFGVEVWPTGERYEGHYVGGCKEGQGKLILAEDTYYVGEFHADKIEGKGSRPLKQARCTGKMAGTTSVTGPTMREMALESSDGSTANDMSGLTLKTINMVWAKLYLELENMSKELSEKTSW